MLQVHMRLLQKHVVLRIHFSLRIKQDRFISICINSIFIYCVLHWMLIRFHSMILYAWNLSNIINILIYLLLYIISSVTLNIALIPPIWSLSAVLRYKTECLKSSAALASVQGGNMWFISSHLLHNQYVLSESFWCWSHYYTCPKVDNYCACQCPGT